MSVTAKKFVTGQVTNLSSAVVATGNFNSNIPSSTTFMSPHFWRSNNATALAVGMDVVALYIGPPN
jgi:hypothetical protein